MRDDLEQFEVAGRVEKVRTQKVGLEIVGASTGDLGNRDARGVGADDAARPACLLDAGHEPLLGVFALHDRFDDPVYLAHPAKVVLYVAQRDPLGDVRGVEVGRPGHYAALPALVDDAIAHRRAVEGQPVGLFLGCQIPWDDVEQVGGDTHVGQVGGDRRPHGAGADDGYPVDSVIHSFLSFHVDRQAHGLRSSGDQHSGNHFVIEKAKGKAS